MKTTLIRNMPLDLHVQLKVLAAQTGRSMNEVIIEAIRLITSPAHSAQRKA